MQISDIREHLYERMGIGSSYLFRLDDDYVVGNFSYALTCFVFQIHIIHICLIQSSISYI